MSWTQFLNDTTVRFSVLQKETPEMFAGFGVMSKAAKKNGVLDEKTKELIAFAIRTATKVFFRNWESCLFCRDIHIKCSKQFN